VLRTSTLPGACAGLATLGALAILGCAPPDGPEVAYDLVHGLSVARLVEPTVRLDFGTEEARARLGAGWSWNERAGDGTTFVWGTGAESVLRLSLNGLRPAELRLRAFAFERAPGSDPVTVEVLIDDVPAATVELAGTFAVRRLPVDPSLWAPTDSVLRLRYRPEPEPASDRDRRPLAAAWDWLELAAAERAGAAGGPVQAGARSLRLGAGQRLDYPVDLEPGSRLTLTGVRPRPAALAIGLATQGRPPRTLRLGEHLEADLGVERFTPAILSLLADPGALPEGASLVLEGPRVVRPAG
jgi:hypothetical protein